MKIRRNFVSVLKTDVKRTSRGPFWNARFLGQNGTPFWNLRFVAKRMMSAEKRNLVKKGRRTDVWRPFSGCQTHPYPLMSVGYWGFHSNGCYVKWRVKLVASGWLCTSHWRPHPTVPTLQCPFTNLYRPGFQPNVALTNNGTSLFRFHYQFLPQWRVLHGQHRRLPRLMYTSHIYIVSFEVTIFRVTVIWKCLLAL